MEAVVGVAGKGERRKAGDLRGDPEFLIKLPHQRLFRRFAGLDLTARKLPQPRQRFSLWPLRKQDTAVGIDQRAGGNEKKLFRFAHDFRQ